MTREQIKSAALKLDPAEREALAEELLLSIDAAQSENIDVAWLAEAHRRDADFRAGRTTARPAHEIIDRLQKRGRQ